MDFVAETFYDKTGFLFRLEFFRLNFASKKIFTCFCGEIIRIAEKFIRSDEKIIGIDGNSINPAEKFIKVDGKFIKVDGKFINPAEKFFRVDIFFRESENILP